MNKKILISLSVIGAIAAIVIGGTIAYFSDTETSTGNIFTAGKLDLQVDSRCKYNGVSQAFCTWTLKDLTSEKFFDFSDVKPGDSGEDTISLHVYNNDAWGCVTITPTANDDISSNEPELAASDIQNDPNNLWDGELAQNMQFMIWADVCNQGGVPGDNIYQAGCDRLLTQGTGPLAPVTWALADSVTPNVFTGTIGPLIGSNNYYIGVAWNIPTTVGNEIQSDSYSADVSFYTEQHRNNPNFRCGSARVVTVTDTWSVVDTDGLYGESQNLGDSQQHFEWFAKNRINNSGFEMAIGTDDAAPAG